MAVSVSTRGVLTSVGSVRVKGKLLGFTLEIEIE